jgi:hypothetical protein
MDMTPDERALMMQHVQYTKEKFDAGKVLIYGPVIVAAGAFGMAVFEANDEAEVREALENDPSVLAHLNTFEIFPMRVGAAQGPQLEQ